MYRFSSTAIISFGLLSITAMPALAMDARSAALGGSAIANGAGVHGSLENPSTLMRLQRQEQRLHLHFGVSMDVQDDAGYFENLANEESLPDDIETEIDLLSGRTLSCDVTSPPETVCLTNTQRLADLSSTVLDILNQADGKVTKATAASDIGMAYTAWKIPLAVHYRLAVTGSGKTNVAPEDKDYVNTFATVLADDQLTADELVNSVPLTISPDGQTLAVAQPEDELQSDVEGSALVREQMGLSLATSVMLSGFNVDIGVTPKFSELRAASLSNELNEKFEDDAETFSDQWKENENTENSFTLDVGFTTSLTALPARVSVVGRNMIPEEIKTKENFVFETTPQLIVGGAFDVASLTLSADLALNKAKVDNLDTQIVAFGAEFQRFFLAVRAGISHDMARTDDATALSLGFSAGPLHIGGRLTDFESAQASAQLSFSF